MSALPTAVEDDQLHGVRAPSASILAIACNYAVPTRVAGKGALCFVLNENFGNGNERIQLLVRSRGGRWVSKWERIDRLTNFRAKIVVGENPIYNRLSDYFQPEGNRHEIERLKSAELRNRIGRLTGLKPSLPGTRFEDKGPRRI